MRIPDVWTLDNQEFAKVWKTHKIKFLIAVIMKIMFSGMWCWHLFSWKVLLYHEHDDSTWLWNVGKNLTTPHSRRFYPKNEGHIFLRYVGNNITGYMRSLKKQETRQKTTKVKKINQIEAVWFVCLLSFFFPFFVLCSTYFLFSRSSLIYSSFSFILILKVYFSSYCFFLLCFALQQMSIWKTFAITALLISVMNIIIIH